MVILTELDLGHNTLYVLLPICRLVILVSIEDEEGSEEERSL